MSDPIFARTRHVYDSYQDYYRLVELSGFDTCYVDEIDPESDNCYIISPLNGEWEHGWPEAKARIILFQLEWCTHPNDQRPLPPGVSEVFTMDKWHAERIGAKYVPIGSHPDLALSNGHTKPLYDAALMAYMGPPRRGALKYELERKGLRLAPNSWGTLRDDVLHKSRAMLHVHQHETVPGVAALRVALAAAYALPYISEQVADRGIFSHSNMLFSDYAHLADFAYMWLCRNDSRLVEDYGRALHQLLCVEKPFRYWIEAAL